MRDTADPDFYKQLYFKPYYISSINDDRIQKETHVFHCEKCESKLRRHTKWKYHNNWFNANFICPDCDKKIKLFEGEETDKFLNEMDLELLGELPMTKEIVNITHNGVEEVSENLDSILTGIVDKIK